ncbi:MAG TPA: hypothetical protein VG106_10595, partial [Vicinamibacterales bacterium]|nr:hypothetical protein [Vicinamibacterales bacterium]
MAQEIGQTFIQWSQPYVNDNGSLSSVGISDGGTVLEVHNGPAGNDGMYYRLGRYTTAPSPDLSSCIAWQPVYPNGIGDGNPISADVNDNFAVQVYQDSDKNLFFQWAALPANAEGQLSWTAGQNYTSGEQPAIAMNNRSQVVAVHQDSSIVSFTLWYATGAAGASMGGAAEILQPDGSSITGDFIQVAINAQGTVVLAYRGDFLPKTDLAQLSLIAGTIQPNGSIVFGFEFASTVLVNGGFDIALDDEGHLLVLCATSAIGKDYLGWIAGTVENNTVTLPAQLPWPLLFSTFDGDNVTMAMNNSGNLVAETGAEGGPPPPFQYFVGQAFFNADYSHWMG